MLQFPCKCRLVKLDIFRPENGEMDGTEFKSTFALFIRKTFSVIGDFFVKPDARAAAAC